MYIEELNKKNKLKEGKIFKISRFKEYIKKTKPHKHDNYHELIFLYQGEGFHTIEDNKYMVTTPECYYLSPGQMHFWQFTSIPKGFVILFKESLFTEMYDKSSILAYKELSQHIQIPLTEESYPEAMLEQMLVAFQRDGAHTELIIKGLLSALCGQLLDVTNNHIESEKETPPTRLAEFQSLLIDHIPRCKKVNEYADLMNTTPQNLNSLCRKGCGSSASELINRQLMLEAKRYILHTENSIAEIADIMEYSDSSNFVKFFKSHEECTPSKFRSRYFQ